MNYLSKGPLREQWKKIYTARKPKTGVSELLDGFDKKFVKYFANNRYDEALARRTFSKRQAETAYSDTHGLEAALGRVKPPVIGKWTAAETTFFKNLQSDLVAATLLFTELNSPTNKK